MLYEKSEVEKVAGEIYIITNTITKKSYIGQTRSHYLNHGKYRPFGHLGRFKSHICEAFSTKKNQSRFLNSSIVKHGVENFVCELLLICNVNELDEYETNFILLYGTKFPDGYNLTDGGQGKSHIKGQKVILDDSELTKPPPKVRNPESLKRSDFTRNLISQRIKEVKGTEENRILQMEITQRQHHQNKFERYRNVIIDKSQIEKYIYIRANKSICVIINKIRAYFVGKFQTEEELKERAISFINELIEWQNTLLLETPLESQIPLLQSKDEEGTRLIADPNGHNFENWTISNVTT